MYRSRKNRIVLTLLLTFTLFLQGSNVQSYTRSVQTHDVSTGLKILIYTGNAYHESPYNFYDVYNISGSQIYLTRYYDFASSLLLDDFDAVLISNIDEVMSYTNMSTIKTWFDSGQKLLWLGGDSDFGGFYNASAFVNPLLEIISSQIRLDAGAIADSQSNDAASFRVIANETGPSSQLVDYVTNGFKIAPFHGPTSVFGWNYSSNSGIDLRNTSLPNVDVIVTSSAAAIALDQDHSLSIYDYYEYIVGGEQGRYPMMVSERFNISSYVVVSGEVIFDDYRFMYNEITEKTSIPHQGMMLVDNMISWVFSEDFKTHPKSRIVLREETFTMTQTETSFQTETILRTETQLAVYTETQFETMTEYSTVTEFETVNNETTIIIGNNTINAPPTSPLPMYNIVFPLFSTAIMLTALRRLKPRQSR